MSEIISDSLTQSGTEFFIAGPICQQGVKGLIEQFRNNFTCLIMLQRAVIDVNAVSGLLSLLHACGELTMLRRAYQLPTASSNDLALENVESVHGLVDLSSLYPGWSAQRWNKLHRFITDAAYPQLQLCWVSLIGS